MTTPSKAPKATVIGWPISQSKSPMLHGYWLDHYGLTGSYDRTAVSPGDLKDWVKALRDGELSGANVTIPHKQAILEHVDVIEPMAVRLEAANTLWFEGDKLHAMNTDGFGFMAHLKSEAPQWTSKAKHALVIGAGGASRSIIDTLASDGAKTIMILNRSVERAEDLAHHFSAHWPETIFSAGAIADLNAHVSDADIIINTSSLGMTGEPNLEIDFPTAMPGKIAYDLVYNPLETPFLAAAKQAELTCIDGLGMLLHQGRPGFQKWFGSVGSTDGMPEVTPALRDHLLR